MKKIYVAWQDESTREWVPVAVLSQHIDGYILRYTHGAKRSRNFVGFGRMAELERAYFSRSLFPFFENRLVAKSRPEYKKYLNWLALDDFSDDPMKIMSVTGGVRMTDSYELIPTPHRVGERLELDFFTGGLRYMSAPSIADISRFTEGALLYLLRDVQNPADSDAILLRYDNPNVLAGYIPKYYCVGIGRLLDAVSSEVRVTIKRVNVDAPLNMRLLCTLSAPWRDGLQLLDGEDDFLPCNGEELVDATGFQDLVS